MLSSCVDDFDTNAYVVQKPGSSADYEYLNEYEPLKNYVDRTKHPDFKVSAALTASEFNKKGNLYTLSRANFDEVVAGNAMKMSSVVSNKGEFNFGTVTEFVNAAEEGGLTIYGHTLAWHSQQPVKWLNTLMADVPTLPSKSAPITRGLAIQDQTDYKSYQNVLTNSQMKAGESMDCFIARHGDVGSDAPGEILEGQGPNGMNCTFVKSHDNPTNPWDTQFFIYSPEKEWAAGEKYKIHFWYKADVESGSESQCHTTPGAYMHWAMLPQNPQFTTSWQLYEAEATIPNEGGGMKAIAFNLNLGGANTYYFADIQWCEQVESDYRWANGVINPHMEEGQSMESFVARHGDIGSDNPGEILKGQGPNGMNCTFVKSHDNPTNPWDTQFFIYSPEKEWAAGEKYKIHFYYKADIASSSESQCHTTPGNYIHWAMLPGNPQFTPEVHLYEAEGTIPYEGAGMKTIAFNLNLGGANTYYFADVHWCYEEKNPNAGGGTVFVTVDCVTNGNLEGSDYHNYVVREKGKPDTEGPATPGLGPNGEPAIVVHSVDGPEQAWDTQFFIVSDDDWAAGTSFHLEFDYKADKPANTSVQAHKNPGEYLHWTILPSTPSFTTEWQHFSGEVTVPGEADGMKSIAFNLNELAEANTYYFTNFVWNYQKEMGATRPQTFEEKRDTLIYAMRTWIDGMMDATMGKVKAWDLINEAVAGSGNVNGYYDLQHFEGSDPGKWDVGGDAFYWQDFFGAENYGVIVEKMAREAYARQEDVNPADLKLFINDYNLESTWDDNKKLESLIYWIGVWEQGGAKIDGIGTQMHISYYKNAADQENQKKHITRMFELMAKTGKLVRVSELDMGIADKQFGTALKNGELTFEDEKAMADYYQWIIEEYFRVIPAAQQYGICQWCITDAPQGSGWRADEPVGLWYQDYTRKPAYAGWAEGLKK